MIQALPAPQRERNIVEDQLLGAGCRDMDLIDRENFGRRWQRQGSSSLATVSTADPAAARLPGAHKALPVRDRKIDRSQRARRQDRTCNDDACRRFLIDDEIGADRKNKRLQDGAECLRDSAETLATSLAAS